MKGIKRKREKQISTCNSPPAPATLRQASLLIVDCLFFYCFRKFPVFILLVTQLGLKAGFTDRILYAFVSKAMRGDCGRNHIFFQHDTSEIIRASVQA